LSLSPPVKFVLWFVLALAVLGLTYAHITATYHDHLKGLMTFTAFVCNGVTSVFSGDTFRTGAICSYKGFSVEIVDECTGLLEMVIYCAAVLAFGTTIRNKVLGLLFGVPAIFVFNILRIIVLLLAGAYSRELFDFMHLYFWQATLIIMIAAVWIGWLYLVVFREKKSVAVPS